MRGGIQEADSQHHNFGVLVKTRIRNSPNSKKMSDEQAAIPSKMWHPARVEIDVFPVVQTVRGCDADAQSGAKAVIEKEAEGTDGYHHLERGKVNGQSNWRLWL